MKKAIQTIKALRLKGAPISYNVINAIAKEIVVANDKTMLVEQGGHLKFTDNWAQNVLNKVQRSKKKNGEANGYDLENSSSPRTKERRAADVSMENPSKPLSNGMHPIGPCSKLRSNVFVLYYCGKQYSRI